MPLLDHFHPPLSRTYNWRGFHGTWAVEMARLLNGGLLPSGYLAQPFVDRDGPIEIDVAALQTNGSAHPIDRIREWAPDAPALAVAVDLTAEDDIRVEIFTDDGDPRLAAAIEIVSPGNKDRPESRRAFVAKTASYLRRGCGVVVVDVVTNRRADLHAELLTTIGADPLPTSSAGLLAVSYRALADHGRARLHAWPTPLGLGEVLPTVPLWLASDLAVPLDLEVSYAAACADLRIA